MEAGRYARHDCAAAHMHACVTFEENRYLSTCHRVVTAADEMARGT